MPTPRELYQAGQLQEAIQALTAEVRRSRPTAEPASSCSSSSPSRRLGPRPEADRRPWPGGSNEALAVQVYLANIET